MNILKLFSNKNTELKWGSIFLGGYGLWVIIWLIYSFILKGSILKPYFPKGDISRELLAPLNPNFIFGSDIYGRSLLEVLSCGLFYSISIAVVVSFFSCLIGVLVGYFSVQGNRIINLIADMTINLVFIFPSILIAIMVMSITGQSFAGLVFSLVITGWPGYAKIAKGEIQRVFALSYVESAKAVGTPPFRLLVKIVIPEILPQILVHLVLGMSGVIISEATLGFLGLGASDYSWGVILSMAKSVLLEAPSIIIIVGIAMAGLIIAANLMGDGLRDKLDVKMTKGNIDE